MNEPAFFQVLDVQPDNAKALFRRGVANMNLNKIEQAESDLRRAQEISPEGSNTAVFCVM